MVKIRAANYSITSFGWLDGFFYQRTGVVHQPYPIGLFPKHLNISQYYSITGWVYERRRTWHGIQPTARRARMPPNPRSPYQQGRRLLFYNGHQVWKGMNDSTKDLYKKWRYPKIATGFNRWMSWWLNTQQSMALYWATLQRSADDSRTIQQKMVDQDEPTIRYPFDFRNYQLFNAVLHQGAGFPESPAEGQLFYDTDDDKVYVYKDPAGWTEVGGGGAAGANVATVLVDAGGEGDYTDIQDGIDALPAGGGLVWVKEGIYTITAPITITKSNVHVIGQGASTIVYLDDSIDDDCFYVGDGVDPYSNIQIENLKIDGNKANNSYSTGIFVDADVTNSKFLGLFVQNTVYPGIDLDYESSSNSVINCRIENCEDSGILAFLSNNNLIQGNFIKDCGGGQDGHIHISQSSYNQVISNYCEDTRGASALSGISIYNYSGSAEHNKIIGNTVKNCLYGIEIILGLIAPSSNLIMGNTIQDPYYYGISNEGVITSSISNIIDGASDNGFHNAGNNAIIMGNQILNSAKNGMLLGGLYNVVQGNLIDYCGENGILVQNCQYSTITGNRIEDVGKNADNLFSGIMIYGSYAGANKMNSIYDNNITHPTSGNRKMYSIREYGANIDYNQVRGNRCKDAMTAEIKILGLNSEAYNNTILGT